MTIYAKKNPKDQQKTSRTNKVIIASLQDTRLRYKSQSLFYIPAMNKLNMNLKTQCYLHYSIEIARYKSNKMCTRSM